MKIACWLLGGAVVAAWMVAGLLCGEGGLTAAAAQEPKAQRATGGLLALYDFTSASGTVVKDRAGSGPDLRIANPKAVRRSKGALEIRGKTVIRSDKAASKIIEAVRGSGEITVEAWVRPANTRQNGPARIVTLSRDSGQRNFTLGQEGDRFDARLRTTRTSTNGIPSLATPRRSLATKLTHVVYTHDGSGRTRVYVDGKRTAEKTISGSTSNWDRSYRLALANELSHDRPWLGTYFLVAIYRRDLSEKEVEQNFQAGPGAEAGMLVAASRLSPSAKLFDAEIGPLLARHCLECHDSGTKKGKLDLSTKATALEGGENGKPIVPGKSAESLLWEAVASDEMPKDRPKLSAKEKKLLRQWIDGGAHWSADVVDPLAHKRDRRANKNYLRRLTVREYIETVRHAVGVDISKEAREILPPDLRADGFSNTAYNLTVDLKHVQAYARLAEIIVKKMDVLKFSARFSRSRNLSTDATMRQFVSAMGKWLLRGPLEKREEQTYSGIATTVASAGGDFKEAAGYIIEAMLQSPRFIYRIENQRGDGTAWPPNDYELASRLSYILWGGPPDEELMRAADKGELGDRRRVAAQVDRMLGHARAVERSQRFIYEWLHLARLDNMRPNPKRFPQWNAQLAADMRDETLAFFKEVAWTQKRPLSDLLNAQVTFATPRLAKHYGLKPVGVPPSGGKERGDRLKPGLQRYDISSVPARGGLLTHGSVLTIGGDEASMVTRGLFVLHDLLRGVVRDPPPCVDTTPVPTKPGRTQRGIAEARMAKQACAGCHAKFEPLAFGLEKFDGLGAFHERDHHGNKLRDDGNILFPGAAKPVAYKSSAELMNLLAGSDRVRECITWKLTQFALGRPLRPADAPIMKQIDETAHKSGGTYVHLMRAIVMSDLVQKTRTEAEP